MGTARTKRFKAAAVAGLVGLVAASGLLLGGGGTAGADVTGLSGSAFGISTTGLLNLGPVPVVSGASPPIAFGPFEQATVGIAVPGPQTCPTVGLLNVLQVCGIDAFTQGFANANPHLNHVFSQAAVAQVAVGASGSTLSLTALAATCSADGNDATGATTLANASINVPLVNGQIAPNTDILIDSILQIRLNEQIPTPNPHTPGINTLTVNAARITVLGVGGSALLEATIGHVVCTATGPDVNEVTTLPPTSTPNSSTPNSSTPNSSTPNSSTPNSSTPDNVTTTAAGGFSSVTTIAAKTESQSIVSGVLARTGAFLGNALVWALLVVFLGGLALLGSRGEVQTWPPKRSVSRSRKRSGSGTAWPKDKPGRSKRRFF